MKFSNLLFFFAIGTCYFSCRDSGPDRSGRYLVDSTGPQVGEGYTVEVVADSTLLDYPMFSTLDEQGRLFVFESTGNKYDKSEDAISNPQFRIKLLEDTTGDGIFDKSTIFADKVGFPQGGVFYKGSLYASSAPELLKLTDTTNDGVADVREEILSGWVLNVNANSLVGPAMAPDGWLYMTSAIMGFDVTTKEGQRLKGETARIWRVRPDGSGLEWVSAGGMNNPVELTFTEASEPIGTETYFTEPRAGERDALVYWIEGGVYPKPAGNISRDKLARTGDLMPVVSKYSRVSPAGICRYRQTVLGNDFKDNLFSAQFNTHRVMRHKLLRDGASFRTEDEIFFWNNKNEDFHPTDVLEDADGSLLIVETGGWFIKGCPLSQVSKPEIKGSIYRVRRKGAKNIEDPYGNKVQWGTLKSANLANYLEDKRPVVTDRALQSLVDQGPAAVQALTGILKNSSSADARTKSVFALYRIGTPESLTAIRAALSDPDIQVSVAAARSAGLSKDKLAVPLLINMLGKQSADPVRRQAATALGQIGDKQAVPSLLAAADRVSDRFINHAIIYSLITLNEDAQVRNGLSHSSPQVREAALIALDQMPGSPLTVGELTIFLSEKNEKLQRTALWIASHHQEWSTDLISFLNSRFKSSDFTGVEDNLFTDLLVAFSEDANMQQFIAKQLKDASKERKLFFLDVMSKGALKKFPASWIKQAGQELLPAADPQVKSKAMELIELRGINSLSANLLQVADDKANAAPLRIQAISGLSKTGSKVKDTHFSFLYDQLTRQNEASIRQQVALILEKANLTEEQLRKIAIEYLPKADAFILPRLTPLFKGNHSAEIGKAVAVTLIKSPVLDGFSEEYLRKIFENYPAGVKPFVDTLMTRLTDVRAGRLNRLQEFENHIDNGVMERGRVLFFGKATCSTCHAIGSQGGKMAPDLTSIQRDRSVHDLLEAIVYPSASFVRGFETYKVKAKSGEYTGIIKVRTPDAIIIETSPQTSVRIPRNEMISSEVDEVSMMPQGLDKLLTKVEMADLMVFLLGQDQDPDHDIDRKILRHTSQNEK